MTFDAVAMARWNLDVARLALEHATDKRERRLIRQNITQTEAWLRSHGVEVESA